MYLSRLILNARSGATRRWLADCHALHRFIMSGFPADESAAARADLGVLYRVEPMSEPPDIPILVQSKIEPHWMLESEAIKEISKPKSLGALLISIEDGGRYRFRLRANPVRRVHRRSTLDLDPVKNRGRVEKVESAGKRVELRREEDQIAWLKRRGEGSGFVIAATRLAPAAEPTLALLPRALAKSDGIRKDERVTLGTVLFEGTLQVTDASRFREAIIAGIGPGKAFGCGLLSIAPVKQRAL